MRASSTLAVVLIIGAAATARAQCPAAIQRLSTDQKYDEARADLQALLKKNPKDDIALECMGRIYEAEGKSGDAVDWYEKAVKVNDTSATHHLMLAGAIGTEAQKANKLRQPFLARRIKTEMERAVALDSTMVDAHDGLMQFYLQAPGVMGGSAEKARAQAQIVGRLSALQGHLALARIARHDKDDVAVEKEYKAAIAVAPDSLGASYSLGALYENQRRWADAFALYDRMITAKPAEVTPHYLYGRVAALSGENMERGEREIRTWMTDAKDPPMLSKSAAHLRLGMIFEQQGKKDAARSEYQTALQINPKSEAKKKLDGLK